MTEARWREIENLFNQALEVPDAERDAWLVSSCGADEELLREVRTLLANDSTAAETLSASVREAITSLPSSRTPKYAGPYELIGEIGRGGMGTVYKARRADHAYEAVVAVKLVRPGMDTDFVLSRFRQERQSLAKLNHPNIARLMDGGTTADGVPYIVMEYIDGVRINEYCRREKLTLEQRLRLMLPVCLATDHAHRHFIVHRDIKPGNVLVDNTGTPKLLDFGICKLLHANPLETAETLTKEVGMLTPDYASPEQVLGESISPRSDVYSLGAVLYELLTGTRPHRFDKPNLLAIEEVICHAPIVAPSDASTGETSRMLRGDLDNILLRALEKDPRHRYESAAALAEDIRRYLEHEPVSARPAGRLYRARKFVRRHRVITGAIAAVLAVSSVGTVVALRQARRAEARERQIRTMARVFLYDVHDSVRDLPGATAARQKIVQTALGYLDALAGSQPNEPELLRELAGGYERIADLQGGDARGANLGQSRAALANYDKAIGYFDRLLAIQPADRAGAIDRLNVLRRRADLQTQSAGTRSTLTTYDQVEAGARKLARQYPGDEATQSLLADVLTVTARRSREAGDLPLARTRSEEALALTLRLSEAAPGNRLRMQAVASAESALGMTLARIGDLENAAKLYQSSVARGEHLTASDPQNTSAKRNLMIAYSHLGDVLGYPDLPNLGNTARAETVYAKMAALGKEIRESDPRDARAATDYAIALSRWARVTPGAAEREHKLGEALALIRQRLASAPANLTLLTYEALIEQQLGSTSLAAGRGAEALGHWRRSAAIVKPHLEKGSEAMVRLLITATRELAMHEPLAELRQTGAARVAEILAVAEKVAARAQGPGDLAARVMRPRAQALQAIYYGRVGDIQQSQVWRQRARDSWKELASHPGFHSNYRREMEEFEQGRP